MIEKIKSLHIKIVDKLTKEYVRFNYPTNNLYTILITVGEIIFMIAVFIFIYL